VEGFAYEKVRALLAFLAVERRSPHARESLAALLWPESDADSARTNLRKALSTLRKALDTSSTCPLLLIKQDTVQINPECTIWTDVDQLRSRLQAIPRHTDLQFKDHLTHLEQVTALYRGSFLDGLAIDSLEFEEWMLTIREALHTRILTALHELSQFYLRTGQYSLVQKHALRQVELEPYREEARRALMLALARSGQRSAALAQYKRCRNTLAAELGIEPSHETKSLYQRILQAGETSPHNLPPGMPELIGREHELLTIAEKLADPDCRLLTITGSGGIGKTSLALAAAQEHLGAFWDGVYFVPLAALTRADQITPAILGELPLVQDGPANPYDQLVRFLAPKTVLLVLDNMEHLLDDPVWIKDLLEKTPYVKLLVTSRERLRLGQEWVLTLSGLAHADLDAVPDSEIPSLGAVRLFIKRAQQVSSSFHISTNTYATVARICHMLEGVPLGIELAAAWAPDHSPKEIEDNVRTGLDFLENSMHDAPARHASLRATFEHSWNLLAPKECEVLRRVTLFRVSFSPEAAEEAAGANPAVLDALVNKSLLRRVENTRCSLHPLIHQFAAEKLAADPQADLESMLKFTGFYSDFLFRKAEAYHRNKQRSVLDDIKLEIDNVRWMWTWASGHSQWEAVYRAHEGLYDFLDANGWFLEGFKLFQQATTAMRQAGEAGTVVPGHICGHLMARQARLAIHLGRREEARILLEESVSLLANLNDRALPLSYLGLLAYMQGDYDQAAAFAGESLALSRKAGGREGEAFCLNMLGNIAHAQGDLVRASEMHAQNLAIRIEIKDHLGAAMARNNLANIAQAQGRYGEARSRYLGSHRSFELLNHRLGMAATLSNAGFMAAKLEAYEEARQLYEASLDIKRELGNQQSMAVTLLNLCDLETAREALEKAEQHFHQALELLRDLQAPPLQLEALVSYAEILLKKQETAPAVELLSHVQSNPSGKHETQQRAASLLETLQPAVPADLLAALCSRGEARELADIIRELLPVYK